jgi:hypothetical protein
MVSGLASMKCGSNATAEHRTVCTTQIVDLDSHRLLDVVQGCSRDVLGG